MKRSVLVLTLLSFTTLPSAWAIEVLSADSLRTMCQDFDAAASNTGPCEQYVQGFVDGAVATDVRVMLNVEADRAPATLTERALRTRGVRSDAQRAAGYAEFCLGDPVPLREVVTKVVTDLKSNPADLKPTAPARDLVYASLRQHYPCET